MTDCQSLARRMLDRISTGLASDAQRAELLKSIHEPRRSHPMAAWETPWQAIVDLCRWIETLPKEETPPQLKSAAVYFNLNSRTIGRWLHRAGIPDWASFQAYWWAAHGGRLTDT